jgi:tetratricopeptide (TPR) repeat protein
MHPTPPLAKVTLLLVLLAFSFDASAARAEPRERESPEKQQSRALIDDAVAEYDAHHFEEARALFRRAHQLEPSARTLRGIGMAAFELRDYAKSLRALEASLVDARSPLTGAERDEVEALAARARAFVGHFVIHLSPKQAVLRVDDAPTTLDDGDILMLESGRHVLTAVADDRRT